ncbi:hypothetical protein LBBP_00312 [Leptospira borgpetersenii serovar Ballum]|uniref:Uncharacterized protein n=1 Tax=Leptospira borgpetersenii serovar Ballum TaxID=280505 RepID=A0A0S2ILX9_LEPBO|nr:hypothetical protein LBBP_00312 [Leptospira borgpetersenii serovar Ballum]
MSVFLIFSIYVKSARDESVCDAIPALRFFFEYSIRRN